MKFRSLTALPVYNEVRFVDQVLDEVAHYSQDVLVVDDGSTDGTDAVLARRSDIKVVTHLQNKGYGAGLRSAFQFATQGGYDCLVTIDCDGQHEPQRIPDFIQACQHADIVSGSRYLKHFTGDSEPPQDRQAINRRVTEELNRRLGLALTDGFCGFKAYRAEALKKFTVTETGYAMPLELWVQAAAADMVIHELPVPLIYLEEERSFGGELDDAHTRLKHYYDVLDRCLADAEAAGWRASRGTEALPR